FMARCPPRSGGTNPLRQSTLRARSRHELSGLLVDHLPVRNPRWIYATPFWELPHFSAPRFQRRVQPGPRRPADDRPSVQKHQGLPPPGRWSPCSFCGPYGTWYTSPALARRRTRTVPLGLQTARCRPSGLRAMPCSQGTLDGATSSTSDCDTSPLG